MAEEKTGMTTAQKMLILVPLAAVCIYAIVLGIKLQRLSTEVNRLNTDVRHLIRTDQIESDHNPYVFTIPDTTKNKCDVSRAITVASEEDTVTFHSLDGSGKYSIVFNKSNSPFTDAGPTYSSDKEYTIKKGATHMYYGFSVSDGNCDSIQYIGIIVGH